MTFFQTFLDLRRHGFAAMIILVFIQDVYASQPPLDRFHSSSPYDALLAHRLGASDPNHATWDTFLNQYIGSYDRDHDSQSSQHTRPSSPLLVDTGNMMQQKRVDKADAVVSSVPHHSDLQQDVFLSGPRPMSTPKEPLITSSSLSTSTVSEKSVDASTSSKDISPQQLARLLLAFLNHPTPTSIMFKAKFNLNCVKLFTDLSHEYGLGQHTFPVSVLCRRSSTSSNPILVPYDFINETLNFIIAITRTKGMKGVKSWASRHKKFIQHPPSQENPLHYHDVAIEEWIIHAALPHEKSIGVLITVDHSLHHGLFHPLFV